MTTEPCCPSRELPLRTQLVVFSVSRGARRLSLLKSWRQGRVGPRFRLGAAEAPAFLAYIVVGPQQPCEEIGIALVSRLTFYLLVIMRLINCCLGLYNYRSIRRWGV